MDIGRGAGAQTLGVVTEYETKHGYGFDQREKDK